MICDFQQCGILTSVDSDKPVKPPFKLQMMFGQQLSTHRTFKRLAKALIRLHVCPGWSEPLLVAHTTLLEISCCGSNVLKFRTLFTFASQNNVGYHDWNSQNACQNSKQGRPWSDCFFRSSLIWVCAVCLLGIFGRKLVFKILEYIP